MVPFNVAQTDLADGGLLFEQTTDGNIIVQNADSVVEHSASENDSDRQYRLVLALAIEEAVGILKGIEQPLVRIGKVYPPALPFMLSLANVAFRLVAKSTLNIRATASSSMQDDLKNGRFTEVDYINGKVVDAARAAGMKAPVNQRLTELIHQAESAGSGSPRLKAETLMEHIRPTNQR